MKLFILTAIAFVALCHGAQGGTVKGQAKSLKNGNIQNVTVQVFTADGDFVKEEFFSRGKYNFTIQATGPNDEGVIVRFSAPNRQVTQVTLFSNSNHAFDVALPEAKKPRCKCCCRVRQYRRQR